MLPINSINSWSTEARSETYFFSSNICLCRNVYCDICCVVAFIMFSFTLLFYCRLCSVIRSKQNVSQWISFFVFISPLFNNSRFCWYFFFSSLTDYGANDAGKIVMNVCFQWYKTPFLLWFFCAILSFINNVKYNFISNSSFFCFVFILTLKFVKQDIPSLFLHDMILTLYCCNRFFASLSLKFKILLFAC